MPDRVAEYPRPPLNAAVKTGKPDGGDSAKYNGPIPRRMNGPITGKTTITVAGRGEICSVAEGVFQL